MFRMLESDHLGICNTYEEFFHISAVIPIIKECGGSMYSKACAVTLTLLK